MAIEDFDQVTIAPAKLRPFSKFIMSIGELPTSYLDSLSYAEQVTWFCDYLQNNVIPALNNNAAALQEVQNLMTELQEYVDNYFTDLDVQEEINNKLDQMAQNGTLYNIIKTYTDPIVNEQNARITSVENQVQSVANGSPLVATSTAGMTDTSRTYVNTSDGKWYYYNGSAWTIGGTYQSTGIADNTIVYPMLNNNLQENIIPSNLRTIDYTITGQFASGSIGSAISYQTLTSSTLSGVMNVQENDLLIVPWTSGINQQYGSVKCLLLTDSNDIVKQTYVWSDLFDSTTNLPTGFKLRIPSGIAKVYVNCITNSQYKQIWYPYVVTAYNYLDIRVTEQLQNKVALPVNSQKGALYNWANWGIELSNYDTNVYLVNPLDKINIVTKLGANSQFSPGVFVDENEKPILGLLPKGSNSEETNINIDVIVPAGAKKLFISGHTSNLALTVVSKYQFSDTNSNELKKLKVNYLNGVLSIENQNNGNILVMQNYGGNNLFMIKSYKVGGITKSLDTDMIPAPYIVNAVNNPNGDRTTDGFTGGNHQWNNLGSGSTATASQVSLSILCDNSVISNNTSNVYCDNVQIIEVNNVQANNTCLQAGGGRDVLQEKIIYNFDGINLKVKNIITPLEDIVIRTYYGIQTSGYTNENYKIYADKVYSNTEQYDVPIKPYSINNPLVSAKLYDDGIGSYQYNHGYKVLISSGKSYYTPIYLNTQTFTTNDILYLSGEYTFNINQ